MTIFLFNWHCMHITTSILV